MLILKIGAITPTKSPAWKQAIEKEEIMEIMNLNTNRGIAGRNNFKGIDDVMSFVPFFRTHNWCDGQNHEGTRVIVRLRDGSEKELQQAGTVSDGNNHIADIDTTADTIGVQIAGLDATALVFIYEEWGQNGEDGWEEYLPIQPVDWTKLRRKVEDALRKSSDKAALFGIAQTLSVKIPFTE